MPSNVEIYIMLPLILGCAIFFFRTAKVEHRTGFLWGAMSVLVSIAVYFLFRWGWIALIVSQLGLFCVMWGLNIWKESENVMKKDE